MQPEAVEMVRVIYTLYLERYGPKKFTRKLNGLGRKTPAQLHSEHCGREVRAAHRPQDRKSYCASPRIHEETIGEAV